MTPTQIKIELLKRKTSQSEIAELIFKSRQMVSMVINGKARSRKIEIAIAASINKDVEKVFPIT